MSNDPHPIVGWARFLKWQRSASPDLTQDHALRLREAINKAIAIYRFWRPELRYKTIEITREQLDEVRRSTRWLIENREKL